MGEKHLHILRHSLGLDYRGKGTSYRNHFVTGEGSINYPHCCELVDFGMMTRREGGTLTGGDDVFHVTEAGKIAARLPSPPCIDGGEA